MAHARDPIIETRGACSGATVRDATMKLNGGLVGLVGANGAGKTTLLRMLAGVAPYSGEVRVGGRELGAMAPGERARQIAYLPQIASLSWPVSVRDLVSLGRLPHGDAETATGREAIARALADTGIEALAPRRVDTLSGGERARVMLARALAVGAPVLIADEPIAALDPRFQIEMMRLLRLTADAGTLVVAALHDLGLAARYSNTVLAMQDGRVIAQGPPETVLTRELIERAFGLRRRGGDDFGPVWEAVPGAPRDE